MNKLRATINLVTEKDAGTVFNNLIDAINFSSNCDDLEFDKSGLRVQTIEEKTSDSLLRDTRATLYKAAQKYSEENDLTFDEAYENVLYELMALIEQG